MKTTNNKASIIQGDNLRKLRATLAKYKVPESEVGVLLLVADVFDAIAVGEDVYMTLGTTRNKSAFSLSVRGESVPDPIYAADLAGLSTLALDLL